MRKTILVVSSTLLADIVIFCLIAAVIYGLTVFGNEWNASYNPTYDIDLSLGALPLYAFFSSVRGLTAYVISLAFTLVVGFAAAKSPRAEKMILPFLDVMQSIPVLGFLPGVVLGLVSIFPRTNVGLELASVLMIFTGQVWNMTFAFYSSLKSVPSNLREAAEVMKLSSFEKLRVLEMPFSAMTLTWNSVMSMAGGWFFLTVCEAFTLGDQKYLLPGLGAYMSVAIEKGNTQAVLAGIAGMVAVIFIFDLFLWRPALIWAHKFRLEEAEEVEAQEPLIQLLVRDSLIVRFFKSLSYRPRLKTLEKRFHWPRWKLPVFEKVILSKKQIFALTMALLAVATLVIFYGAFRLIQVLFSVPVISWLTIIRDSFFTLLRVAGAVTLGTLWATPMGIWIAQSPKRLRWAQPIIQMLASFPAPMLYPLAIALFVWLKINFEISSMLLMLLGVQWYILFNVLAGALRIPTELRLALRLMQSSRRHQWRYLFLPSVLPSLVTGWVTAAGGAWNASIVAELITFHGQRLEAHGLGANISEAAARGDFNKLAACLVVMIVIVVLLNRTFWAKLYAVIETRYRLDL